MRVSALLCLLIALPAALGCGGARFDGRTFQSARLGFRVGPLSDDWRQINANETLLAFRNDVLRATLAVNGRCGKDGDDVPLEALTRHLFIDFRDRQVVNERLVKMDGREALRTELSARLDGVDKRFLVVVLKKDTCVYDFWLITDRVSDTGGAADFDRFVSGFATASER